jgi:Protein of unknown function (DUF2490)
MIHRQKRPIRGVVFLAVLVVTLCRQSPAQTFQFWPEIDTFVKLNEKSRLYFIASQTRENRTGTDAEIGPNIDFYLKPLLSLKEITIAGLDESKSRPIMLRFGYRYMPSTQNPTENRIVMEATPRFPFVHGVLVTDRNRGELRFIQGRFSWRYRNRLAVQREFRVKAFHFIPYGRAEAYYDSNYNKFSRIAFDAGSIFPIGKHVELEEYYEHQNDTSKSPNRQVNAVSAILNLYF